MPTKEIDHWHRCTRLDCSGATPCWKEKYQGKVEEIPFRDLLKTTEKYCTQPDLFLCWECLKKENARAIAANINI